MPREGSRARRRRLKHVVGGGHVLEQQLALRPEPGRGLWVRVDAPPERCPLGTSRRKAPPPCEPRPGGGGRDPRRCEGLQADGGAGAPRGVAPGRRVARWAGDGCQMHDACGARLEALIGAADPSREARGVGASRLGQSR